MGSLATLFIDKSAIIHNIRAIQSFVGTSHTLIPVVKANMYGIGISNILNIIHLSECTIIAVAHIAEALEIRNLGFDKDILVLIQPTLPELDEIMDKNISVSCGDIPFLLECQSICQIKKKSLKIHIEIDVGMGRTGLSTNDVEGFINQIPKCNNITITGIFTHLPNCSNTIDTTQQLLLFNRMVNLFKKELFNIQYVHSLASSGIFRCYRNVITDTAVRSGLSLLGYYPNGVDHTLISLIPSVTLISHIVSCKEYQAGTQIGYNRFLLKRNSRLGIIPIGFADALIGYDAPGGYVVIRNKKAEVISICMDTMIIDITDIRDVCIGDDVYVWDNKLVTLDEWGLNCKSSIYEIIALLSSRIYRIVI